MKKLFILFLFTFSFYVSFCQLIPDGSHSDTTIEFATVQVEAKFPGGLPAWRSYLEQNLNIGLADSCLVIPKGKKSVRQTIIVSFRVDKTGKLTDVKAENYKDVHPLLAAEAVRVIKNGPDWIPAEQNNMKVIYRQRQNITWVVSEE